MLQSSMNRRDFLHRGVRASLAAGLGFAVVGEQRALAGYPNYCFSLRVPWLCQVPPGDWSINAPGPDGVSPNRTKNCGQTCCTMLGGYFKGRPVNATQITGLNSWLARTTGNSWYNDPAGNGYYTNFSGANTLGRLLSDYYGLRYGPACGTDPSAVVNQAAAGKPCIVGVMIGKVWQNGQWVSRLVSSGGAAHWAIVTGWDGNIILNDPGTTAGSGIRYSVSAFDASWATSGRTYCPVSS